MIVAAPLARTRALAVRREATAWVALGTLVVASTVVRVVLAHWHTAPRYFPDEYIYAALSRSLAHGHLMVRDQTSTFYAILQPLLAAPLWHFFPPEVAYRLVQAENALAASLVVVPVWLLGRQLDVGRRASYLVCVYALTLPTLALIPVTISDFVAYPLVIGGVAAAVRSLDEPTRKRQLLFLVLALLATLARIQYGALVPAYLVGAFALDRRGAIRRHGIVFLSLVPALIGGLLAITGYYSVGAGSFRWTMLTWIPLQAFILSAVAGAVLVPGAVAAILRPAGRTQSAFSWVTTVMILLTFVQASVPGAQEDRFKQRYLFALLPLVALAFAMYLRNGRPHRWLVLIVSAAFIGAAARLPFSYYTAFAPRYDAQSLTAIWLLQQHIGATGASLVVAILVSVLSLLAILISLRGRVAFVALPLAVLMAVVTTAAAIHVDYGDNYRAVDPGWIDRATGGKPVTAIATPYSDNVALIRELYWSASVEREVVLDNAFPTDIYAKHQLKIGPDGELRGVTGYFLFDRSGTQATFAGATRVARQGLYELLRAPATPRFRLLVENRVPGDWLAPLARLRMWPSAAGQRVGFTLSLPKDARKPAAVWLNLRKFVIQPGERLPLRCASGTRPLKIIFVSSKTVAAILRDRGTVRLTDVRILPGDPATTRGTRCAPPRG